MGGLKRYFVIFIFFLFWGIGDVNATSFNRLGYIKYNDYSYEGFSSSKPSYSNYTYYKVVKDTTTPAYCAQHSKVAPKSSTKYSLDSYYSSYNGCGVNKNVDCSSMVGYIIFAGNSLQNYNDKAKYFYTQLAIQTYLYNYSNNDSYRDGNRAVRYAMNNQIIAGILSKAETRYNNAINKTQNIPTGETLFSGTNSFGLYISSENRSVNDSSLGNSYRNMYYNPNNGYYVSYHLKVNGPSTINSQTVTYTITSNDADNILICDVETGKCDGTISVGKGKKFYIMTESSTINPIISVQASVNYVSGTFEYMDSERYNSNSRQDMIILSADSGTESIVKKITKTNQYTFSPVPVASLTCKDWNGLNDDSEGCSAKTEEKECQSNLGVYNKSTAEFKGCSSHVENIDYYIKISDGSYKKRTASVGILVLEEGTFVYGGIYSNQNPLYAGGGFGLLNTYYKNSFSYNYKYVYSDKSLYVYYGNEYFVNQNTIVYPSNNSSGGVVAKDYFKQKLLDGIINGGFINNLEDKFEDNTFLSYDTNEYSESINYVDVVDVTSDYDEVIKKSGWLPGMANRRTVTYKFNLKNALRNLDNGNIEYKQLTDDTKYVNLGDKYYTYIKYQGDKYPFNIYTSKVRAVSVSNSCNWTVDSKCDIDVNNNLFECEEGKCSILARYRSIDVNNPFPKASNYSEIPFNWRSWYYLDSNKNRLKRTYNQYIYKLELNNENIYDISKDKNYTSWDNMLSNGSSNFINKDYGVYFDNNVSGNSYCKLGEFSSECDK